ncbi:MAG: hypothetical protein HQL88_01730 [Magnetococcales bacterium]|nr:hypothetical protein [Magnetococcales bacterium]
MIAGRTTRALCVLTVLLCGFSGSVWGADGPGAEQGGQANKWGDDPKQIVQRMESLNTLIEKSSGARRIAATGNPEAASLQDQARSLLQEAQSSHRRGDLETAKQRLSQASQVMFQAMRKADGGASGAEKQANDFQRRLDSVQVLLAAHQRISREKRQGEEGNAKIQADMDQAVRLNKAGSATEARAKLDEAYVTAKMGIEKLRRGDTLVRSLHFDSKEEEYHYEVDRNNTHIMLVNMLLESKPDSAKAMASQFVEQAKVIRQRAEALAARQSFEQAISSMEESTKELVKAIRSAGIFIPG